MWTYIDSMDHGRAPSATCSWSSDQNINRSNIVVQRHASGVLWLSLQMLPIQQARNATGPRWSKWVCEPLKQRKFLWCLLIRGRLLSHRLKISTRIPCRSYAAQLSSTGLNFNRSERLWVGHAPWEWEWPLSTVGHVGHVPLSRHWGHCPIMRGTRATHNHSFRAKIHGRIKLRRQYFLQCFRPMIDVRWRFQSCVIMHVCMRNDINMNFRVHCMIQAVLYLRQFYIIWKHWELSRFVFLFFWCQQPCWR